MNDEPRRVTKIIQKEKRMWIWEKLKGSLREQWGALIESTTHMDAINYWSFFDNDFIWKNDWDSEHFNVQQVSYELRILDEYPHRVLLVTTTSCLIITRGE